jgi:diguanylate cyclase (GGDEF)-like protein
VLEPTAARFETRNPPNGRLTDESLNVPLVEDLEGRILTSIAVGLSRWQEGGWQDFTKAHGIPDAGILSLLVSRDGQVWLGTRGGGMLRWPGYGHFESWTMAQGLGDLHIQSIASETDRSVLLSTEAGCYRLEVAATMAAPCRFSALPRGGIQAMTRGGGALWIGTTAGGLFRIGAEDQQATRVADLPPLHTLYVDSAGRLWIGTDNGVVILEPGAAQLESMPLPAQVGKVTDVTEDAEGAIWLATQRGLLRWSGGRWIVLDIDGEKARAGFASVAADRGGWLWAGGAWQGMLHVHVQGDVVDESQWVPDLTLAHAAVKFMRIDPRGWVWAGTDSGVVIFDGRNWRRFNTEDGLIWNTVVENSFLADTDGSLWIGTRGGATHITKPEALMQDRPIGLRITRSDLGAQGPDAESTRRSWEPTMALNLHIAELNYGSVGRSYLRVRLRGLGDQWLETHSHDLQFRRLGPGHYTFEAVAIDPEHKQTSDLTQLSFEIPPPWWRTRWFELTAAAAAIPVFALAWSWRTRKRKAYQREIERQKKEHRALLVRATRDSLTGLWNRAAILEILARAVKSAKQHATPLAVAIIDIDHFKRINDTRGHLAGDEVLRTLGAKLISQIRASDFLGRFGGEEFLLVVPGAPTQTPFLPLERLQRAIAEIPFSHAGSRINVTASFGVAWLMGASDTAELLLGRADAALYSAKDAGRNRVEYAATG